MQRFLPRRILGEGGSGRVWLVDDAAEPGRSLALKELAAGAAAGDGAAGHADRLRREYAALASLRHPGIVEVHEFHADAGDTPRFTLEYIEGRRIVDAVHAEGAGSLTGFAVEALRTLHFLHGMGLVHRDLKPENVLVRDRAKLGHRVVFVDFGLAITGGAGEAPTAGTLPYMAPELLAGESAGARTDLYALGAVLFEAVHGVAPFPIEDDDLRRYVARVTAGTRAARPLPGGYPPGVAGWLDGLLAAEPGRRPVDAADALSRLGQLVGERFPLDDPVMRAARLRSGPPAERLDDVDRVRRALESDDPVGVVWLVGAAGCGKSRVLRWLECEALLAGRPVRRLHPREPLPPAGADAELWLIDDADEAGGALVAGLARLARRRAGEPLRVVVGVRSGAVWHPALRDLLQRSPAGFRRVELEPLGAAALQAMAQRALGAPVAGQRVQWLLEACEGSPARAETLLVRGEWERGRDAVDSAGDGALPDAGLVAALEPDARRWLEALAVLEESPAAELPAELADLDPAAGAHAEEELAAAGLVRRDGRRRRIVSRLLAAAIRERLGPDASRTLHARAARALEPLDEDPWTRCRLWAAAGEAERAIDAARAGGELALEEDPGQAAHRFRRALVLLPRRDPRRRELRLRQAEASMRAGQFAGAVRAYGAALRLSRDDGERLEALAGQSHGLVRAGRFQRALAVAEATRRLAERRGDAATLARATKDAGVVLARLGHEDRAIPLLETAREQLERAGEPLAEAEALQALAACKLRLERTDEAARDYERSIGLYEAAAAENSPVAIPALKSRIGLAVVHARAGNRPAARAELEAVRETARAQGNLDLEETALSRMADLAIDAGRLDEAMRLAGEAADLSLLLGESSLAAVHRCRLADAQIRSGRSSVAAAQLQELLEQGLARVEPEAADFVRMLLAAARLEEGEHPDADARELLGRALDGCRRRRKRRAWLMSLTFELERRSDPRSSDPVEPVIEEYERVLASEAAEPEAEIRIRAALARARAAANLGDPQQAGERAEQAARDAEAADAPGFAARAWALRAETAAISGDEAAAAEARRRGHEQRERALQRIEDASVRESLAARRTYAGLDAAPPAAGDAARLAAMYDMIRVVNSTEDPEQLLEAILDLALRAVRAERGMILLRENETFSVRVARGLERETVRDGEEYSRHVVAEAGRGRSLLAVDAGTDRRFRDLQSVSLYGIRSLMCVPLRSAERIVGTVYLDSRKDGGLFSDADLRFVEAFADHAALALQNARKRRRLEEENRRLRGAFASRTEFAGMVGGSAPMLEVFALIDKLAQAPLPVLIEGESGTGKELVARAIHERGPRRRRPFLSENCAAIPESLIESELFGHVIGAFTGAERDRPGLFEQADGGTIFLDEVGDMSPAMQAKLLRVVQEGELRRVGGERPLKVDVRIVAATHRDLEAEVRAGRFRLDLLYRLRVLSVPLPPLRRRVEDIPLLVEHFLRRIAAAGSREPSRLEPEVRDRLLRYAWPGNVRELENVVQRLALAAGAGPIHLGLLRDDPGLRESFLAEEASGPSISLASAEREQLERALAAAGGNRSQAARLLGVSRATLYRKLGKHSL